MFACLFKNKCVNKVLIKLGLVEVPSCLVLPVSAGCFSKLIKKLDSVVSLAKPSHRCARRNKVRGNNWCYCRSQACEKVIRPYWSI